MKFATNANCFSFGLSRFASKHIIDNGNTINTDE